MFKRLPYDSGNLRSYYVSRPSSEDFADYMNDYRRFRPYYVSCDLPLNLGHRVDRGCRHRLFWRRQQPPAQPLLSLLVPIAPMPFGARPAVSLSLTPRRAADALTRADPSVRQEPLPAQTARSLLTHSISLMEMVAPSLLSRVFQRDHASPGWVSFREHTRVSFRKR
jgi:hypothetical protein